jgi:ferrous iron transport protein B
MSCSARLPVYVLLSSAFFPQRSGLVMLSLYATGILLAVALARLFKRFLFNEEDIPFVMELPPYRMPTGRSVLIHVWEKGKHYLRKMGGVILAASVIIWFLGYFPLQPEQQDASLRQQRSYIGQIGQAIQPALAPLGFDWKISISLLSGMAAKEVVVSTLGVLYTGGGAEEEETQTLSRRLQQDTDSAGRPVFTPLTALSLMLFVLIYFPCIATVTAIARESGSWKWGGFVIIYTCLLAWLVSFAVYQAGSFLSGLQLF